MSYSVINSTTGEIVRREIIEFICEAAVFIGFCLVVYFVMVSMA